MNTLIVYVKQNGEYIPIRGAIVNFTTDELLDEQLDQARLVVINSPVENYPPLTEFRIDFLSNNIVEKSVFYLSGESNTITYLAPINNEKRYKIDVLLIERTKLLEGIMCQSLTFTNAKGKQWGEGDIENPVSALIVFSPSVEAGSNVYLSVFQNAYKTPIMSSTPLRVKSLLEIWNEIKQSSTGLNDYYIYKTENTTTITNKGKTTTHPYDYTTSIYCDGIATIEYRLEVFRGTDTSYTYDFDVKYIISAVENRYPLKPYTITDCICRCLELCQPLTLGELPKYKLQGVNYTFNTDGTFTRSYEAGSQAEKYDKIIAPNFTMTQCTLREQLKVIGGYIHAEPRLGYKVDGNGLQYEENTIVYEEFEQEETTNLTERGHIYRGVSQSLNNYCTSVTTNVANLVNTVNYFDGVISDPTSNAYRTLRTDTVNVMLSESNARVHTQFPVYNIIKVMCGVSDGANGYLVNPVDITPYVFEQHEYNNLSSYDNTYPYAKSYAIYYTQGQKGLDGLFFKNEGASNPIFRNYAIKNILDSVTGDNNLTSDFDSSTDYQRLVFQVSYIPIYSSMFSHGKNLIQDGNNNFTIPYAQSENLTESTYYGEHLKGVANRMGNVEEVRTYIVPDITYLPKTGQIMKTEKGDMVISRVSSDMRHTHFKVTVALTKEFNRLSQYVGVNSHKRVSEVSEREAYARDVLIKEYAIIGDFQPANNQTSAKFIKSIDPLAKAIRGGTKGKPISAVICAGATKSYYQKNRENYVDYYNVVALPVISSAFGNAMVFSWSYKDNYSAIESLQPFTNNGKASTYQTDTPYSDYYGRFNWYDFSLLTEVAPITNNFKFANGTTAQQGVIKYPDDPQLITPIRSSYFETYYHPVLIRKDSREALNFNFEIEFVTNRKDLIIGSAIASQCELIGTDPNKGFATVYFFKGYKFDKYPRSLVEVNTMAVAVRPILYVDGYLYFEIPDVEFDSWCVAYDVAVEQVTYSDEDNGTYLSTNQTGGEITLACNNGSTYYSNQNKTAEQIYITPSNTNLKGV